MCNRIGKDNLLTDIKRACDILKNGGVILYPTDTIWGIGCDVKNEQAIKRIYTIKQRTNAKSMLILVNSIEMLCRYIESVPPVALKILEHEIDIFNQPNDNKQERPITIIYPQAKGVSPLLLAENSSLGIRITKEPFSNQLCEMFGHAIVSTSANISGDATPRCFSEISSTILHSVDYVCESRRNETQKCMSSIIIKLENTNSWQILRN